MKKVRDLIVTDVVYRGGLLEDTSLIIDGETTGHWQVPRSPEFEGDDSSQRVRMASNLLKRPRTFVSGFLSR